MNKALPLVIAFLVGVIAMHFWHAHRTAPVSLEVLTTVENAKLGLPFSEATRIGNTMYVSGQIGVKPGSLQLVPGGVKEETRQTMDNIRTVLKRYGSSLAQVAKCTVFLGDIGDWPLMNEAYVEAFGDHLPARSALGASGLALNGTVEIECIAFVD
jgi:reactive intermediate/imine deaminase